MTGDLPEITTARLSLRIAGPNDAARCVRFNRDNAQFLAPWEPAITSSSFDADAVRIVRERSVTDARSGSAYSFAIFMGDPDDDASPIAGWITFSNVVRGVFQACHMGYKLDQRMQGHGYMTEAAQAAIDYFFQTMRLHRIMANYMPHNQRSAAVLRRLGFKVEGSAKAYLFIAGQWRDHVLTSLINPEPMVPPGYDGPIIV